MYEVRPIPAYYLNGKPTRPYNPPRYWRQASEWDVGRVMAVEAALLKAAARHEAELRALLGMWVSEATPSLVINKQHHWLGLTAEELVVVGERCPIILPISLVRGENAPEYEVPKVKSWY